MDKHEIRGNNIKVGHIKRNDWPLTANYKTFKQYVWAAWEF